MNQEEEWPGRWTAQIGEGIREARRVRRMSAEALSQRCAELGYVIPRNTITNLENGRKSSIPLHELEILALALRVPPAALAFYPGDTGFTETSPGNRYVSGAAVLDFSGEGSDGGAIGGKFQLLYDQVFFAANVRSWVWLQRERANLASMPGSPSSKRARSETRMREMDAILGELAPLWISQPELRSMGIPDELREQLDGAADLAAKLVKATEEANRRSDDAE